MSLRGAAAGHYWTITADLRARVRPSPPPVDAPWSLEVPDAVRGHVRLGGRLRRTGSETLVMLVHGLGGNKDSPYIHRAARAVAARGLSCLRVDLRGADGRGADYYHAGLSSDLHAIVAACADWPRVVMVGYSLGGHVVLRYASEPGDDRVRAVAAVCAPLDLAASAAAIDRHRAWLYRVHVLRNLVRTYREVAARHPVPTPVAVVARARTIRRYDELVVVPRHGFASVDDYYARASAGPRLGALRMPALWLGARHDPMVPEHTVRPSLLRAASALDVRWVDRGGHVGFPDDLASGPVEDAVLDVLARA
jgi:hypothetical protein